MKKLIIHIIVLICFISCTNKKNTPHPKPILDGVDSVVMGGEILCDGDTSVISINGKTGNTLVEKRDSSLSWLLSQQHCLMMAQKYGYDYAYTGSNKSERLYKKYRDSVDYYYNKITGKK